MSKLLFGIVLFLLSTVLSLKEAKSATDKEAVVVDKIELGAGTHLRSGSQGVWQVLYLPMDWIRKYWPGSLPSKVYVGLFPPHNRDLATDYAPCSPPSRIILGIMRKGGLVEERLVKCLYYCSSNDLPGKPYGDLWGSRTYLEGITAQIDSNGTVVILEHLRERSFVDPSIEEDLRIVNKLRLGEPVMVRRHVLSPKEIASLKEGPLACVEREEP
ncbi:MAG: hypothetical protein AB7P24_20985 [Nitrospira sp.]